MALVSRGYKIIVTTRDKNVARMVGDVEAHHAIPMSEEDGWSLFEKHAFRKANGVGQSDLEEIGRQIVRKCNGLPLAIKSLGGLLRSRSSKEEWETILESEIWELPERENGILPSLWLSYIDLPPHLRRCFACCAIFPKNFIFPPLDLLFSLWKAEDLLQLHQKQNRGRNRTSLLQRTNLKVGIFLRTSKFEKRTTSSISKITMFKNADNFVELPDSINNLIHLRHLDLSWNLIIKLPETICTLYNLQMLSLAYCSALKELPANLGRLINLSHLDLTNTVSLKRMPPGMGNLKQLQILTKFVLDDHTAESNLPELKKLENLHGELEISGLEYSRGLKDYILRDKKFLKELVLKWDWICDSEESDVLEKLQPHPKLERLTIHDYGGKLLPGWSGYYSSAALVFLELYGCENCTSLPPLGQLPSLTELRTGWLRKVVTIGFEFYYGVDHNTTHVNIPFRCLRTLKFSNMWSLKEWSYVGDDYNEGVLLPKSGLPASLQSLEIKDCYVMHCWPDHGLPSSLQDLSIYRCSAIQCLPETRLPSSLQSLTIQDCVSLWCLPECGLPSSLSNLMICGSFLLERRCKRERRAKIGPRLLTSPVYACHQVISKLDFQIVCNYVRSIILFRSRTRITYKRYPILGQTIHAGRFSRA